MMETVTIPENLNKGHLGFTLDYGGSAIKVLYRPKQKEQKNEDEVELSMAFIDNNESDKLFEFLSNNCNITVPEGESPEAIFTGVGIQRIEKQLMDRYGIKAITSSEFDALAKGILYTMKNLNKADLFYPVKQEIMEVVLMKFETVFRTYASDPKFGELLLTESSEKPASPMKLYSEMTKEEKAGATMMTNMKEIAWPMFVVVGGSAMGSVVLQEDGQYELGDFSTRSGKMLLGLGQLILGTRDFNEILEMATRGDPHKLHTWSGDMKVKDRLQPDDHYAKMPDFFPIFSFGKAHDKNYDGTYTKEDIAAALVNHIVMDMAHVIQLNLQVRKLKTALITGSFFEHELVRDMFYEEWHMRMLFLPDKDICVKILHHSGHVTAIGCWMQHFDKQKEQ